MILSHTIMKFMSTCAVITNVLLPSLYPQFPFKTYRGGDVTEKWRGAEIFREARHLGGSEGMPPQEIFGSDSKTRNFKC